MKVRHELHEVFLDGSAPSSMPLLLTNKSGGYFCLDLDSRYRGLFTKTAGRMMRSIEDISVEGNIKEVINKAWCVERKRDDALERFFVPFHSDTLVYEVDQYRPVHLFLDFKESYDNRQWGRDYSVSVENKKIVVTFTKRSDSREDGESGGEEYRAYLVIEGDENLHYKKQDSWERREYAYDRDRGSTPSERYVYHAMTLVGKRLVFAVSDNKQEAMEEAEHVLKHCDYLKELQQQYHSVGSRLLHDDDLRAAVTCAAQSLDGLLMREDDGLGLYAGLPWFFQYWSRDEAISLKGLLVEEEFRAVKQILLRQLRHIKNGQMPSQFPANDLPSADALGWHARRWLDLLSALSEQHLVEQYFSKEELQEVTSVLERAYHESRERSSDAELFLCGPRETWMDSLPREGARIEIQALWLCVLQLLVRLTGKPEYEEAEDRLREVTRKTFWNGRYLADGADDQTIRPNLFLAAYLYPRLLTGEEWKRCFTHVLPALWLSWGGLATVDTGHASYHAAHTGENPDSYHNGDSWFWVNNLAAIVLHRMEDETFSSYVQKILRASTEDILWKGAAGHHSELSSAQRQSADGSLVQAWSAASYLELLEELFGPLR